MFRPVRTDAQARHCPLSGDYLPLCGPRGITSWSLVASGGENFDKRCRDFASGKIAESPKFSEKEDSSLQTALHLYILVEGKDIIERRIVVILLEHDQAK